MKRSLSTALQLSLISLVAVVAASCANDVARDDSLEIVDNDVAGAFTAPVDVDAVRIYLGEERSFTLTDDMPWQYGAFELVAGGRVWIDVWTADGSDTGIGFKLYRVRADGTLALLGTVDGRFGWAWTQLRSKHGGTYVVEAAGNTSPLTLTWQVTCARPDGNCAPLAQPGELCGTRGVTKDCDDGLYCAIEEGCGRDDRGGACQRPAEICLAVYGPEVCGCDGKTYSSPCNASGAGQNVDYTGACPCDPMAWNKPEGFVDVVGAWIGGAQDETYRISSRLVLLADGSFTYEQVWDPLCTLTPPYCRMASRLLSMHGTWEHQGFAVQLYPVQDPLGYPIPEELAQSFGIETTCEGEVRLTTTELNVDRVLDRDRCWEFQCEQGQHCELQQVMCIRAPCPPLPQCVAD